MGPLRSKTLLYCFAISKYFFKLDLKRRGEEEKLQMYQVEAKPIWSKD